MKIQNREEMDRIIEERLRERERGRQRGRDSEINAKRQKVIGTESEDRSTHILCLVQVQVQFIFMHTNMNMHMHMEMNTAMNRNTGKDMQTEKYMDMDFNV